MEITAGNFNQESKGGGLKFLFILFLLLFVGGITITFLFPLLPNIHDIERHGADAVIIDDCLNSVGHLQIWQNKTNGRIARICEVDKNLFGIRIDADQTWTHKITAFIKEKLKSLWQVERYLQNSGYECVNGCVENPGVPRP